MSFEIVERAASWPLVLPYFDGKCLRACRVRQKTTLNRVDLTEYLVENKAATLMMRVNGDSMKDADILDGDLLVVDRPRNLSMAPLLS